MPKDLDPEELHGLDLDLANKRLDELLALDRDPTAMDLRQLLEGRPLSLAHLIGRENAPPIETCRLRIGGDLVAPGQTMTFILEPGVSWRPTKLGVDPEAAPYFVLCRIKTGVVDQLAAPNVPAAIFASPAGGDLILDTCHKGLIISVEVMNMSDQPRTFRGWWDGAGPGALSIRGAEPVPIMRRGVIAFRVGLIEPGEHRRCELEGTVAGTAACFADRVMIPPETAAQGVRLVDATINGRTLKLSPYLNDVTELEVPGRTLLETCKLGAGDLLVMTFAHAATGDRPQAIDVRGAVIVEQEWTAPAPIARTK